MSTFAKLNNGVLEIAPKKTTRENVTYAGSAYTDAMKAEDGYKNVVYASMPTEDAEFGYHWESGWVESANAITQTWTQVENLPTLEEKVRKFLSENLKNIETVSVQGNSLGTFYTLVFDTADPEIDTGDASLDEEIKHSLKKTTITDPQGQPRTVYVPLFDNEALDRLGVALE